MTDYARYHINKIVYTSSEEKIRVKVDGEDYIIKRSYDKLSGEKL